MDALLERRLSRLKNRTTLYELAMTRGEERLLVAYCRQGRPGLFNAVSSDSRRAQVIARAGTDQIHFATRAQDGATMGEWTIRFTGRTQRDAILQGELPYVADTV